MQLSDLDVIVREFLLTDEAGTKHYQPITGDSADLAGVEVLPGLLYRYQQSDPRSVTLQVFTGVGKIGAQLWEQEVRVLLRVASLEHPALPEVVNGGHIDADRISSRLGGGRDSVAYVRTLADTSLDADDIDGVTEMMHADLVQALRQLWLLADGLSILHDARIAHRNLWPGTLQAYKEENSERWALRLSRFEMSALLSNILRPHSVDVSGHQVVRTLYLSQDHRALRYAPPERLLYLLHETTGPAGSERPGVGSAAGDVFGLGMLAAEWFLGGFADPPDPDRQPTLAELAAFQQEVRRQVRISPSMPTALGSLLDDMLDPVANGRPTTAEVLQRLSKNYDGIVSLLQGKERTQPHLLLYLPETRVNLAHWGLVEDPTDEDEDEVARVIQEDLCGALVVESPEGAEPYVDNWRGESPEKLRQTKWVLLGSRAAWFCRPYELHARAFRAGELLTDVFVVGYVALYDRSGGRERLRKLEEVPLHRRVDLVQVESNQISPEVLRRLREDRPNWTDLFDTVRQPVPVTEGEQSFAHALDFLLEYQGAQLQARTYAFWRDPETPPNATQLVLHWDRERDRERRDTRLPPLHAKLLADASMRPSFAHFFEETSQADEGTMPYLRMDWDDGSPRSESMVGEFRLVRTIGEDTVVVSRVSAWADVPERGLLSPASDSGTRTAINRQTAARHELVQNRTLVNRLIKPKSIQSTADRWRGAAGKLEGEGSHVVTDMLRHQVIYALQGPPGTGKTEVSSQAICAYLRAEPQARILVSAQSHFALDNLAARILVKLGVINDEGVAQDADFLPIRLYNERAHERVDERLRQFQVGDSAVRLKNSIRRRVAGRMDTRVDIPKVRQIAASWLAEIDGSELELGERLRRGANLVFVTCAAATRETLVDNGSREPFDWVIIEEAAKAWPTELALPLVRGLRWTLVGDPEQIGAFGQDTVERFLNSCLNDPNPEIAKHYGRRDEYLKAFELFRTMIRDTPPDGPVKKLREQRRMHDPICQVISRAFYPEKETGVTPEGLPEGTLVTMRPEDGHVITEPDWLPEHPLIWLDTSGMRQEEGYWSNRYEAGLIKDLVEELRPRPLLNARPDKAGRRGLAILTPYRRQVDVIKDVDPRLAPAVRTVDSFQGREADIVIVSLVRDKMRASWDRPLTNIGHLADDSRVNVMLSRARDLQIIVGSFDHFAGSGMRSWQRVTEAVTRFGIRRPAATVKRA